MHNYAFILSVIQKLHGFHVKTGAGFKPAPVLRFPMTDRNQSFFKRAFTISPTYIL